MNGRRRWSLLQQVQQSALQGAEACRSALHVLVTVGMAGAGNSSSSESSANVVVNLLLAMSPPIRCRDPDCETGIPASSLQSDFHQGDCRNVKPLTAGSPVS